MCELDAHDFKSFGDGIYRCVNCHYVFDVSAHVRHTDNFMNDDLEYDTNKDSWEAIIRSAAEANNP